MEHPAWCDGKDPDCARRGAHCGMVQRVGNPRRPLTTVWLEQRRGRATVVRQGLPQVMEPGWTPEQTGLVVAALQAAAKEAAR